VVIVLFVLGGFTQEYTGKHVCKYPHYTSYAHTCTHSCSAMWIWKGLRLF